MGDGQAVEFELVLSSAVTMTRVSLDRMASPCNPTSPPRLASAHPRCLHGQAPRSSHSSLPKHLTSTSTVTGVILSNHAGLKM